MIHDVPFIEIRRNFYGFNLQAASGLHLHHPSECLQHLVHASALPPPVRFEHIFQQKEFMDWLISLRLLDDYMAIIWWMMVNVCLIHFIHDSKAAQSDTNTYSTLTGHLWIRLSFHIISLCSSKVWLLVTSGTWTCGCKNCCWMLLNCPPSESDQTSRAARPWNCANSLMPLKAIIMGNKGETQFSKRRVFKLMGFDRVTFMSRWYHLYLHRFRIFLCATST